MITSDKTLPQKLDRLIDENLDNPSFSIDSICQELGVSRSQLHRIIKEQAQISASLYIRKRRLSTARHLLTATNLRIAEVSDRVGFSNAQNFSTYFTEEFGVSPTEFRKLPAELPILPAEKTPSLTEVTPTPQPLPNASAATSAPQSGRRRGWRYAGIATGLLLLLATALAMALAVWQQTRSTDRPAKPIGSSLVILPFTNLGAVDSSPACEGIMDDVHTSISLIKNLKVIARSSSDQYKDTRKSIWQIGDELQVANVLKGRVLKTDNQIQVRVEIISTRDDIRVWVKTYSAAYRDLFKLTDQIVGDVARQLNLTISTPTSEKAALTRPTRDGGPAPRPTAARTQNPDAYNALLQGRQLLVSRLDADLLASITHLDRALALDSSFAEAYAVKAVAYHLLRGSDKMDTPTLDRLTEENALQAIRLDPTNSTAYGVLGSLYYATYQWQASDNAFRIALQHNPNDAQANHWYALLMRTTGRFDEAVHYSAQAIALDPLHPIMMSVYISNCSVANRFDLARTGIETGRGLFNKSFSFQLGVAYYWLCRADYGRAATCFQQMLVLNPDDKGQIPILLYCGAKRGNRQPSRTFLHDLKATTPRSDYERAVVYAGLDQADSSLHYLKKAADGGYLYRDTKVLPVFKPYHSHPIFRAVMRRFKLPQD